MDTANTTVLNRYMKNIDTTVNIMEPISVKGWDAADLPQQCSNLLYDHPNRQFWQNEKTKAGQKSIIPTFAQSTDGESCHMYATTGINLPPPDPIVGQQVGYTEQILGDVTWDKGFISYKDGIASGNPDSSKMRSIDYIMNQLAANPTPPSCRDMTSYGEVFPIMFTSVSLPQYIKLCTTQVGPKCTDGKKMIGAGIEIATGDCKGINAAWILIAHPTEKMTFKIVSMRPFDPQHDNKWDKDDAVWELAFDQGAAKNHDSDDNCWVRGSNVAMARFTWPLNPKDPNWYYFRKSGGRSSDEYYITRVDCGGNTDTSGYAMKNCALGVVDKQPCCNTRLGWVNVNKTPEEMALDHTKYKQYAWTISQAFDVKHIIDTLKTHKGTTPTTQTVADHLLTLPATQPFKTMKQYYMEPSNKCNITLGTYGEHASVVYPKDKFTTIIDPDIATKIKNYTKMRGTLDDHAESIVHKWIVGKVNATTSTPWSDAIYNPPNWPLDGYIHIDDVLVLDDIVVGKSITFDVTVLPPGSDVKDYCYYLLRKYGGRPEHPDHVIIDWGSGAQAETSKSNNTPFIGYLRDNNFTIFNLPNSSGKSLVYGVPIDYGAIKATSITNSTPLDECLPDNVGNDNNNFLSWQTINGNNVCSSTVGLQEYTGSPPQPALTRATVIIDFNPIWASYKRYKTRTIEYRTRFGKDIYGDKVWGKGNAYSDAIFGRWCVGQYLYQQSGKDKNGISTSEAVKGWEPECSCILTKFISSSGALLKTAEDDPTIAGLTGYPNSIVNIAYQKLKEDNKNIADVEKNHMCAVQECSFKTANTGQWSDEPRTGQPGIYLPGDLEATGCGQQICVDVIKGVINSNINVTTNCDNMAERPIYSCDPVSHECVTTLAEGNMTQDACHKTKCFTDGQKSATTTPSSSIGTTIIVLVIVCIFLAMLGGGLWFFLRKGARQMTWQQPIWR